MLRVCHAATMVNSAESMLRMAHRGGRQADGRPRRQGLAQRRAGRPREARVEREKLGRGQVDLSVQLRSRAGERVNQRVESVCRRCELQNLWSPVMVQVITPHMRSG